MLRSQIMTLFQLHAFSPTVSEPLQTLKRTDGHVRANVALPPVHSRSRCIRINRLAV